MKLPPPYLPLLTAALLAPAAAQANVFVFDSFDYTPGTSLNGQNGGTGFSTAWTKSINSGSATEGIEAGSLSSGTLSTSGSHANLGPRLTSGNTLSFGRNLSSPIGADNSKVYFSVVLRPEGTLGQGMFGGFFGIQFDGPFTFDLATGYPGGALPWGMDQISGIGRVSSTVQPAVGTPTLLVMKMEFGPPTSNTDKFTLYVNPTSGEEPASGLVKQDMDTGLISRLALQSGGAYSVDELRLGTTFGDVVPGLAVPEPEEWAAMTGAILLVCAAGRRHLRKA
jgi:hypothetical protein